MFGFVIFEINIIFHIILIIFIYMNYFTDFHSSLFILDQCFVFGLRNKKKDNIFFYHHCSYYFLMNLLPYIQVRNNKDLKNKI
jgi:hypothetical protein